jgi:hypothetical protein
LKTRAPYKIGIGVFTVGVALLFLIGIKNPPKKLKAVELSLIETVTVNNDRTQTLTESEINYWRTLEFELAEKNYPGETPDFVIRLGGTNADFTAMYNVNGETVFFSFVSEVKYGFLNTPPPGGWTKPIYETQADKRLLELLKIE